MKHPLNFKRSLLQASIGAALILSPTLSNTLLAQTVTAADAATIQHYQISAGPLGNVLNDFAQQSGISISFNATDVEGLTSNGLQGRYSLQQAFDQLLLGQDLNAKSMDSGYVVQANNSDVMMLDPVQIEGARISDATEGRFGDAPAEPGGFKAEYQTTATKMAMSIKDTPQAISVVTRDSMDARQAKDIVTAVELTAGVSGTNRGAPGVFGGRGQFGQGFSLRGQELKYYRDVRTDGFSAGVLSAFDLAAYDRIEVVKGPAGFYGQGSLGGFINLVRKKPKTEFGASVSSQIGSYDTYRTEADITGALTEDKHLRGRFIAAYEDAGSFINGVKTETTLLAPSFEAQIGDNTRLLLQMLYQKENFHPTNGMPMQVEGNRLKAFDLSRAFLFGAIGSEQSSSDILDLSLRIDHQLSDRWLTSFLLQGNETNRNIIMNNAGFGSSTYGVKHDTETNVWAGELRLEGDLDAFGREHKLLFGIEQNQRKLDLVYGYSRIGTIDIYANNFADVGFKLKKDIRTTQTEESKRNNKALYGQTVLNLHDRTKLLVSARYDWAKLNNEFFGRWSGTSQNKLSKKALTIRIGLTQQLTDNISSYATYGESFNPVTSTGKNGNILAPETGESYELGIKSGWFDNKLGATFAVYRQELDNRPITDPASLVDADPSSTYDMSAGMHRMDGIELELSGSPMPGLTLVAAANWSNNEFIDNNDDNYGLSIDGSIDQQFSLYANYEIQQGALKGLGLGATLVSVGERQFIRSKKQVYVNGYERVDLNFSYKGIPGWDMSLLVRNVFDKTYIERVQSGKSAWTYYGSPRAALLQVKYNFD